MRPTEVVHTRTPGFADLASAMLLVVCCLLPGCQKAEDKADRTTTQVPDSVKSLEAKAEKGDKDAQFALGVRLESGEGVQADDSRAAYWYAKAAAAGHLGAIKNLAILYYRGKGVQQDYEKAFALYQRAAEMNDVGAINSLASMYMDGLGVQRNYGEALRLFQRAANVGYPYAQTNIGIMYRFGWGVKQDFVEAYARWLVASKGGDPFAGENLKKLQPQLDSVSISRAESRAEQIQRSIQPSNTDRSGT